MIPTDYHIHSVFSSDGQDHPRVLCHRALALGLSEIAITEHAEWILDYPEQGFLRVADYFVAIKACRKNLGHWA